eukprot:489329-Prorocentrum_minimum.AAC.1
MTSHCHPRHKAALWNGSAGQFGVVAPPDGGAVADVHLQSARAELRLVPAQGDARDPNDQKLKIS